MSDREIKKLFYLNCSGYIYVPSIFEDEVWDYLMSTVGEYVGTIPVWEKFYDVAVNVYNRDTQKMADDITNCSKDLADLYKDSLEKNFDKDKFKQNTPFEHFITIPNGRYLTFDVRNAVLQYFLHYDLFTEEEYNNVFKKYEKGETLKTCKWLLHKAFFAEIISHRDKYNVCLVKHLINDTIFSEDPIFKDFQNKSYHICGDRLYVPIREKELSKYNDILYKDYTAANGVRFFVDICEKKEKKHGDIIVTINDSPKSTTIFYSSANEAPIGYSLYPQIYKKITRQPLEKYDLAYGYDDEIKYFKNKIWNINNDKILKG